MKTKGFTLDLLYLLFLLSLCLSSKFLEGFKFWLVNTYIPGKNRSGGGQWFGKAKMGVSSYACMLICSHLFECEHLITFQFCALMLKISNENFASFVVQYEQHDQVNTILSLSLKIKKYLLCNLLILMSVCEDKGAYS